MASDQQCMGRYWENNPHMGLSENGKLCINQCIFGEPGQLRKIGIQSAK